MLWRYSGSAAKKEMALVAPGRVLGKFVTFVLKVVSHRDACDSVIEPGFEHGRLRSYMYAIFTKLYRAATRG